MAGRSLPTGMTVESSRLAGEADRRFQAESAEEMTESCKDKSQESEAMVDNTNVSPSGQELVACETGNLGAETGETPGDARMCRICHGGPEEGRLISPCKCTGSIRFVHVKCLQHWQALSPNSKSFYECDTCKFKYRYARTSLARVVGSKLVLHAVTLVLLVCLMFLVGYVGKLIQYGMHRYQLNELASIHEQLSLYLEEQLELQAIDEAFRAEGGGLTAAELPENASEPGIPVEQPYIDTQMERAERLFNSQLDESERLQHPENLDSDEDAPFWGRGVPGEEPLDRIEQIRQLIAGVANVTAETEKEWSWRWFAFGIDTAHWLYGCSIVGMAGFFAFLLSLPFTMHLWWNFRWRAGGGGGSSEGQGVALLVVFVMAVGLFKSFSIIYKRVRVRASVWLTSLENNILDIQSEEA